MAIAVASSGWLIALATFLYWWNPFVPHDRPLPLLPAINVEILIVGHVVSTSALIAAFLISKTRVSTAGIVFLPISLVVLYPDAATEWPLLLHAQPPAAASYAVALATLAIASVLIFAGAVGTTALCSLVKSAHPSRKLSSAYFSMYGIGAFARGERRKGFAYAALSIVSLLTSVVMIGWLGLAALLLIAAVNDKRLNRDIGDASRPIQQG